ncbi:eukaryotic integral membrane protein [Irpex rosettiformis]|uniref:Eukaryotic integral membrane protein n=1 Tax=Irpex rosettiformis TaxID=378272 RepID=A0ACB8ULK0_9APHY|nr:eukaryotic integral membrane protein [Irpex rosettiformis]
MAVLSTAPLQLITSIPPVTRAFTALTVASSLLYYWLWWTSDANFSVPWLVLVPGSSIFYPWTFVTSAFVETTVLELAFTLITIPASLRYLERLWGAVETLKFVVVTIAVSNIIAFGLNWIEYFVLRSPLFLYGMWYHGQMALQIGVLVAFTQLIPEHQVQLFGVLKARVKTLPMAYLTLSTVLCIVGFQCPWIVIQFGWLVSWVWLRFYKKNSEALGGPLYGDRSETFALTSWFPPLVHKPLTWLGNTVYGLATKFHLIPLSASDVEAAGYSQLPGGARAEAERRRAMALKALDQRVASGGNAPPRAPTAPINAPSSSNTANSETAPTLVNDPPVDVKEGV